MPARLNCPYDLSFMGPVPPGFRLFLTPGMSPDGSLAQGTAGRVWPKYHFPGSREKSLWSGPGVFQFVRLFSGLAVIIMGFGEACQRLPTISTCLSLLQDLFWTWLSRDDWETASYPGCSEMLQWQGVRGTWWWLSFSPKFCHIVYFASIEPSRPFPHKDVFLCQAAFQEPVNLTLSPSSAWMSLPFLMPASSPHCWFLLPLSAFPHCTYHH